MWLAWYTQLGVTMLASFLSALYFGPICIALAHKLNFLDFPTTSLKNHRQPTPYLGGLVVYLGMLVALMLVFPLYHTSNFFVLGATFLLLIGLVDDSISLKPYQKIVGQLIATTFMVKGGLHFKETFLLHSQPLEYLFWVIVSGFWMLVMINAFNLVDVMDGLAATIALTAAIAFFALSLVTQAWPASLFLGALIGALLGFLWFNRPPARIYLGDAGSLFVGGILGAVPFMIPWGTFSWHGYIAPLVILFIPLLEVGTLIIIRTLMGIPFYQGSPHHFSHFLRKKGWSPTNILIYTVLCNVLLCGLILCYLSGVLELFPLVLLLSLFVIFWYFILFFVK